MDDFESKIAQCVGLWLAEGDNKTHSEVTFTNNCFPLIKLFHHVSKRLFLSSGDFRPRLYSYKKEGQKIKKILSIQNNEYFDKRARKPYYIYRFSSVKLTKIWKEIVRKFKEDEQYHIKILQGFFAGEGNVKSGKKNRALRIAQKYRSKFFEVIFDQLQLTYNFRIKERSYIFWSRTTWDIFAKHQISDLHPEKKQRFETIHSQFKEYHYPKNYLLTSIPKQLKKPKTAKELSKIFSRSQARVSEILIELKKQNKVEDFRVGSKNHWVRIPHNFVIISKVKEKYLNILKVPCQTYQIAKTLGVTHNTSRNRLSELEKLRLVEKKEKLWHKKKTSKIIVVL